MTKATHRERVADLEEDGPDDGADDEEGEPDASQSSEGKAISAGYKRGLRSGERLAMIAIACAFGASIEDQATLIGVTRRAIKHAHEQHRDYIERVADFVDRLLPASPEPTSINEYKDFNRREMFRLAPVLYRNARRSGNPIVQLKALQEAHKVEGLAVQNLNVNHGGSVGHEIKVLPSPGFLNRLKAAEPKQLVQVIEAERVE